MSFYGLLNFISYVPELRTLNMIKRLKVANIYTGINPNADEFNKKFENVKKKAARPIVI